MGGWWDQTLRKALLRQSCGTADASTENSTTNPASGLHSQSWAHRPRGWTVLAPSVTAELLPQEEANGLLSEQPAGLRGSDVRLCLGRRQVGAPGQSLLGGPRLTLPVSTT